AFPETWLPGYPAWLDVCRDVALWDSEPVKRVFERHAAGSVDVSGESGKRLAAIAAAAQATVAFGVVERVSSGPGRGTLYNSLLTYGPDGALLNHHRKLVPTYTERLLWGVGDAVGLRSVDAPGARIGGLICWEHWMPLARQALHQSGEDIHIAAWPAALETHHLASRHYAFEGRCFVLVAASVMRASALPAELEPHPDRVKAPDQWVLRGGSAVIAPDGTYIALPVYEREETIVADLDLGAVRRESMTLDVGGHYSRPDCFDFAVKPTPRRER
ncbi:MAG TPA: carbon-nitrogen hydrolase family protein, partial [Gemmatimonadaceae bacterium]|nr:carbon-nitrogen hydrolase family protein [Gemmatimonadaceae bacterium]